MTKKIDLKNKKFKPNWKCRACKCIFEKREKHGCLNKEKWIKLRKIK